MTTPRTKHSEYKRKLVEWARIFEQEYGTSPTEEDRVASNTWNALNDKATYYKRMLKEQSVASSPSLQTPSPSGRRSSGSRRESSSRESRSRESSSRDKSRSRFGVRSHESSPDLLQKSRSPDLRASSSPEKSRRRSSRPVAEEEIVFDTAETAEAAADPGPPPLPEVPPALVEHPEVASLEAKARESREKLLKWERAYEREQGDPPRPEDRAASSTYTSYERKYDAYRSQLELLLAELKGQPVGAQIGPGDAPTRKKRLAISAEAGAGIADMGTIPVTHAVIPKGPEAEAAIEEASKNCVLFSGLGAAESRTVVDAMFEVRASAGQTLINEGEKGDNFYIVQGGNYAVFLKAVGPNPVVTYGRGDSFGESVLPRTTTIAHTSSKPHASSLQPPASQASSLSCALHVRCMCTACALHVHVRYMCTACALHVHCMCAACASPGELALMYNCPRAATVKCTASGVLWALDRATFRTLICSKQARRSPRTGHGSPRRSPRCSPRRASRTVASLARHTSMRGRRAMRHTSLILVHHLHITSTSTSASLRRARTASSPPSSAQ